jgi:hypothetical protein
MHIYRPVNGCQNNDAFKNTPSLARRSCVNAKASGSVRLLP